MKTKNSKIILVVIVCILAVLACAFAVWKLCGTPAPISPLTARVVSAVKVPDGWYEHMVELDGAAPPTYIVLTKHATLPIRNAGDGPYDDPQIIVTSATATGTPEDYIAQEGLTGANADAMDIKGSWSAFMGHPMFAIDIDQVGNTVLIFGNGKVYSFVLSTTDPSDATAFWQVITYYTQPAFFADTSDWKTYIDPSTGFTIKYPSQYSIDVHTPQPFTADAGAPMYGWGSRTLLQIYNPASTSTGEFTIGPVQVTLQKQPVTASGAVYHTIAAYQKYLAAQMVQGAPNPKGDLMTIQSGEQGLFYSFPANPDTGADPGDDFFFIKNDLIYDISFDANDPNEQGMLESIAW